MTLSMSSYNFCFVILGKLKSWRLCVYALATEYKGGDFINITECKAKPSGAERTAIRNGCHGFGTCLTELSTYQHGTRASPRDIVAFAEVL